MANWHANFCWWPRHQGPYVVLCGVPWEQWEGSDRAVHWTQERSLALANSEWVHSSVRHGLGRPMAHGLGHQWVWAGLEFLRHEWALDGPGLEFWNCMNNAVGEIIHIKSNFIVLFNTVNKRLHLIIIDANEPGFSTIQRTGILINWYV